MGTKQAFMPAPRKFPPAGSYRLMINAAFIAAVITLAACCADVVSALAAGPLKIYAFGDSITYGFAPTGAQSLTNSGSFRFILGEMLEASGLDARIVNGGVPGETVAGAKARFNGIFLEKPDVVVIMFGTNDCMAGADGRSQVPLDVYKAELEGFVRKLLQKDIGVILMTSPPLPTNNIPVLTNRRLMPYIFAVRETALKNRVDFVDNFANFNDAAPDKNLMRFFLADAIHPNAEGHKLIAEGIFEVLRYGGSRYNQWKRNRPAAGEEDDEEAVNGEENASGVSENDEDEGRAAENLALGKTYMESAKNKNCAAGVLTDGEKKAKSRSDAYFTSDSEEFPKWILIDLGKTLEVKKVRVYNAAALDARNISVHYALEPGKYKTVGEGTFRKPSSKLDFQIKKPVRARYIKLEIEDAHGGKNRVSLAEVEVFGAR
jgi:acyl-CoA thioesterase-1